MILNCIWEIFYTPRIIFLLIYLSKMPHNSPVHVVLFSLLVDQLFGLFLTFLVDQKQICSVLGNFWSVSEFFSVRLWFFGMLKRNFGIPKRNLVDQKNQSLTKNSLRLNKFFFGRPKKGRNRLDNWSTKRLTKTTWTGLMFRQNSVILAIVLKRPLRPALGRPVLKWAAIKQPFHRRKTYKEQKKDKSNQFTLFSVHR